MTRQRIDNGGWFDLSKSEHWDENTYWDGNNHISVATGSQWDHECLYRTAKGSWVLNHWSQWQGSREAWVTISEQEAHEWLIANSHFDAIPEEVLKREEI